MKYLEERILLRTLFGVRITLQNRALGIFQKITIISLFLHAIQTFGCQTPCHVPRSKIRAKRIWTTTCVGVRKLAICPHENSIVSEDTRSKRPAGGLYKDRRAATSGVSQKRIFGRWSTKVEFGGARKAIRSHK